MEADAPTEQHFFAMRHDGKPLMEFTLLIVRPISGRFTARYRK
jgi:hypothetical protein